MTAKTVQPCSAAEDYRQQLAAIGGYLKTIRTHQGLSLQQVSQRTRVQPNQLRAIETGDARKLPEAIYVRGFLKQYAQALGLNGEDIAAQVCVEPANIKLRWLNQADFSSRSHQHNRSLGHWWAKLTPLV
ncbi:helix-turn-helix domain-containing protein [Leptothoe kymatousa]|uniref:Helix-turn-helix domain-containing protein n=1 Tax=Leptothoe kymatousa TAU-MAC 1615 TaxID=2364775 RepID=A0ABS5XZN8_9CYAN|nr:helix-turn-helix domain-containing protein [Leptothoe kymatousa]MBT9311018.1 helix-turn-helix domain-containing protein [Leptothoe kymatousa TAU-MAC 1615]